ncbi:MAG: large conductance mechanosensitive channel protein MscL [Peptoniphilus sp.]|nr:large conductance mechanosensitive channel protein MscL [Peptoniphilus sp.]
MGKFIDDFKDFIAKGNVLDMAVGVIIGGAFGKIVTSLVEDIIMPIVGMALGNVDFTNIFVAIGGAEYATYEEAKAAGAAIGIGSFINNVVNFLIIALCIFIFIRQIAKIKDKYKEAEEEAPATTKVCPYCKSEIDIEATRCPHCTSEL